MNFLKSLFYTSLVCVLPHFNTAAADTFSPLASWNDNTTAKAEITEFIKKVTLPDTPSFVPASERIAVFDLDGTLMVEKPVYSELYFALAEVSSQATASPEWKVRPDLTGITAEKMSYFLAHEDTLMKKSVYGLSKPDYSRKLDNWLISARNPQSNRLFTQSFYQPMKELIQYLKVNDFRIYIVTGSSNNYAKVIAERALGLKPSNVIGSQFHKIVTVDNGKMAVHFAKGASSINIGDQKVINIDAVIGQRPTLAFGNSDGDLSMLKWTEEGTGPSLAGIIHHTDAVREWKYDQNSRVGRLDKALSYGVKHQWLIVDMKKDWKRVY